MENPNYYITYADRFTNQNTIEGTGLNNLLNQIQVTDRIGLMNDGILTIFHHTSDKQSHIFLDFAYSKYARVKNARTPAYGVKGKEWKMFRPTHYSQIYFDHEEELYGPRFNERVFGRNYLTENECVDLSRTELEARAETNAIEVSYCIPEEDVAFVCRVLDQICSILEKNAQTRIVLLMEHQDIVAGEIPEELLGDITRMIRERDRESKKSEEQILEETVSMAKRCAADKILQDKSLKLMQELYLMFPHRLRLQNGFMTCITESDLNKIISMGWPIYITTADKADFDEVKPNDITAFIDLTHIDYHAGDSERIELLTQLASNMNRKLCTCFSFAEQEVLKVHGAGASSFKYYKEIIRRVFDSNTYWWNRTDVNTIEDLYDIYNSQLSLMEAAEIESDAIKTFYMQRVPESSYADQVIRIIRDEQYHEREKYLNFLGTRLYADTQINAAASVIRVMEEEKADALEEAKRLAQQHERDAVQYQIDTVTKMFEARMREQQYQYEERQSVLKTELEQAKERLEDVKDLQNRLSQSGELLEKLRNKSARDEKHIRELNKRIQDGGVLNVEMLWQEKDDLTRSLREVKLQIEEIRKNAEEEMEDEREISAGMRKKKNIFLTLMIIGLVLAAGGSIGAVYGLSKSSEFADAVSQAESEKAAVESENQKLNKELSDLSEKNTELLEKNKSLESEKEQGEQRTDYQEREDSQENSQENSSGDGGSVAKTKVKNENGTVVIEYDGQPVNLK